jgi:ketosteroid isomerase-like protein
VTRERATETEGGLVVERVQAAMNAHDIEALVACFDDDYRSDQPAHPDRGFGGRAQVRENWSAIFAGVPDFEAELVDATASGDVEWSEWRWRGTHADGTRLDMAGVIVGGVRDGRLAWARLYVEPVEHGGAGIRTAVRRRSGEDAGR